jgi:hypothetical protein
MPGSAVCINADVFFFLCFCLLACVSIHFHCFSMPGSKGRKNATKKRVAANESRPRATTIFQTATVIFSLGITPSVSKYLSLLTFSYNFDNSSYSKNYRKHVK